MSSIGAICTVALPPVATSSFAARPYSRQLAHHRLDFGDDRPARPAQPAFIALRANLRNPLAWQALIRPSTDDERGLLVGPEDDRGRAGRRRRPSLLPAALRFSLIRSAWCLIVWTALWSGWTSPPIRRCPSLSMLRTRRSSATPLFVLDRTGRAGHRQRDPPVVVIGAEVDHQHEEGDQLEDDVEERRQVGLGLELGLKVGGHRVISGRSGAARLRRSWRPWPRRRAS